MNKAGYKIIHIGDGTENGYCPIVIVKASPIKDMGFGMSFTPYECGETELFFFPNKKNIVDRMVQIAQGEGVWHPNENDFQDKISLFEGNNKRFIIHRHNSFWTDDYSDMNSGHTVNLIPDIQYKAKTLNNQYYRGNWFESYCCFRSYVESLAEGDDVQNFWGWLFNRPDFNGCMPYALPEEYFNEYERFLGVCESLDSTEY